MQDNFYGYAYNGAVLNARKKVLCDLYRLVINAMIKKALSNPIWDMIENHFSATVNKIFSGEKR